MMKCRHRSFTQCSFVLVLAHKKTTSYSLYISIKKYIIIINNHVFVLFFYFCFCLLVSLTVRLYTSFLSKTTFLFCVVAFQPDSRQAMKNFLPGIFTA